VLTVADWNYLEGARVLAPAGVLLNLARLQHWEARYDHPSHPSLLQKPTLKNHRRRERGRERERDGRFSHHLSFQFLYGACSPDPRRTKALSFWLFLLCLEGLFGFFPLRFSRLHLLLGF